jgi:diguanylate cyclase (GGDEF)-like protein/PAS domain S-box-containing protein
MMDDFSKLKNGLEEKQRLLQGIMDTMPDFLYTIDLVNSKLLLSNHKISDMLGYPPEEDVEGESGFFEALLHPDDMAQLPVRLEKYKQVEDETVIETEYRLKHVSGSWHWFRSREMVFEKDEDGNPTQVLGIAQDITVYKLLQEKLWTLSTRDALTGLYNQNYFENELERLKNSRQFPVSVVMMDINDLDTVNDEKGHAVGDRLLRSAAEVFSKAFRTGDVVARIGEDEFAVLLPTTDTDAIKPVLERISNLLKKHNQTRGHEVVLGVAVGHATAEHPEQLQISLKQAEEKMYADKAGFKNG